MEYIEKTLTAIITHGTSSITFTDDFITDNSIIDVYFSSDDIVPTNQEQIGNRLIISIEPKNYDVSIAVHITNDDTINYADELESLSDTVDEHATAISDLAIDVDALDNKVDGLNASNINYDEHSTLYSAMGDIDSLETENKNLVGAINEVKESGGGGGGSVFVDYSNKITSINTHGASWTATVDCYVCGYVESTSAKNALVYVNDIVIFRVLGQSSVVQGSPSIYLKKGQVISTRNDSQTHYALDVYALQVAN